MGAFSVGNTMSGMLSAVAIVAFASFGVSDEQQTCRPIVCIVFALMQAHGLFPDRGGSGQFCPMEASKPTEFSIKNRG